MKLQFEQTAARHQSLEEVYKRLAHKLRCLRFAISGGTRPHDTTTRFAEADALISALPLSTEEFAVARHRLRNTVAYLHSGERGAALYELRLLARCVIQMS